MEKDTKLLAKYLASKIEDAKQEIIDYLEEYLEQNIEPTEVDDFSEFDSPDIEISEEYEGERKVSDMPPPPPPPPEKKKGWGRKKKAKEDESS